MEDTLIADLAIILFAAGITTLIFKKLNQPLVLGYIIAGFIASPNFTYFPTIAGKEGVELWAEIGVIFLMFAIGLEFSFYKLKKVGSTAFIATGFVIFSMIGIGYTVGNLLGWNHMNSLFLGGMLSMSSTAIIVKALEEMGLKDEKFANLALGMLIIEDIAGIVMMVLLSTIAAATADVSPIQIAKDIGKLVFCLVLWFVLGMYFIPSFFKRYTNLFNSETLVVVSIGLCLLMVEIAEHAGYSAALGAFIMGSLIAETPNAEEIEHLIKPIKDLFAAVFFVSVGMLVDPAMLIQYAVPVLIIVVTTVVGQIVCATLGTIAAGQPLKTAVQTGFCFCQIGEFSFILAALGSDLGVTSEFLYPIIVAVSVITTFTTPTCIGLSHKAHQLLLKLLPAKILNYIQRNSSSKGENDESEWTMLLKEYSLNMTIFSVLLMAIAILASTLVLPYLTNTLQLPYPNYITAAIALVLMAPILRFILDSSSRNSAHFSCLWFQSRANHIPLIILYAFRIILALLSIYYILNGILGWNGFLCLVATATIGYFISTSNWLLSKYLSLQSSFVVNLNEKHVMAHDKASPSWFDEKIFVTSYKIAADSPMVDQSLIALSFSSEYSCDVILIQSGQHAKFMPSGKDIITANSTIMIIGTEENLEVFAKANNQRELKATMTTKPESLRSYMLRDNLPEDLQLCVLSIPIDNGNPLLGKTIRSSNIRENCNCMVIGLERKGITVTSPNVSLLLEAKDLLWILGKPRVIRELIMEDLI